MIALHLPAGAGCVGMIAISTQRRVQKPGKYWELHKQLRRRRGAGEPVGEPHCLVLACRHLRHVVGVRQPIQSTKTPNKTTTTGRAVALLPRLAVPQPSQSDGPAAALRRLALGIWDAALRHDPCSDRIHTAILCALKASSGPYRSKLREACTHTDPAQSCSWQRPAPSAPKGPHGLSIHSSRTHRNIHGARDSRGRAQFSRAVPLMPTLTYRALAMPRQRA